MLKSLKTSILSAAAFLITLVAMSGVSTACMHYTYEPDIPESLKRDL